MPIGFLAMLAIGSVAVMLLWNWLMPAIFGLTAITFWQSLGLLALSRMLFGHFGHCGHGAHSEHHDRMRKKWMNMTPEQRQQFVEERKKNGSGHMGKDFFDSAEQETKNE